MNALTEYDEADTVKKIEEMLDRRKADKKRFYREADYRLEFLRKVTEGTAQTIIDAALVFSEMERNGDVLPSFLGKSWQALLRQVVRGDTLPEVVFQFKHDLPLMSRVARYPRESQKQIAEVAKVDVAVQDDAGKWDTRKIDPIDLGPIQKKQVFGPDDLRDQASQIAWREEHDHKERVKRPQSNNGEWWWDRKKDALVHNGEVISYLKIMELKANA